MITIDDRTELRKLVAEWQAILQDTSQSRQYRAARIANAIGRDTHEIWQSRHPAYDFATVIAAQLELPSDMSGNYTESWMLLRAAIDVLENEVK